MKKKIDNKVYNEILFDFLNYLKEKNYSKNSRENHNLDIKKFLKWINLEGKLSHSKIRNLNSLDIQS